MWPAGGNAAGSWSNENVVIADVGERGCEVRTTGAGGGSRRWRGGTHLAGGLHVLVIEWNAGQGFRLGILKRFQHEAFPGKGGNGATGHAARR